MTHIITGAELAKANMGSFNGIYETEDQNFRDCKDLLRAGPLGQELFASSHLSDCTGCLRFYETRALPSFLSVSWWAPQLKTKKLNAQDGGSRSKSEFENKAQEHEHAFESTSSGSAKALEIGQESAGHTARNVGYLMVKKINSSHHPSGTKPKPATISPSRNPRERVHNTTATTFLAGLYYQT